MGLGLGGVLVLDGCGDAAPSAAAGLEVTDQRGTTLRLDHPARRVVTIPMPAASLLIAVDQGVQRIAGMHQASWTAIQKGILGEIFPAAKEIPHAVAGQDFSPNVESVLALDPDLIVQWADEGTGVIAPLENAGLTVLGLKYGTQRDLESWIALFAAALGKPGRGQEMLARMHQNLAQWSSDVRRAAKPSMLYLNRFTEGLKVATHNTYNDYCIKLIGAVNPATGANGLQGEGMAAVDIEQVLAWDPDVVLLGNFDDAVPDDVYRSRAWKDTRAVRDRRVYKVPLGGYRWDPPSHESPLMWRWLSMVAAPGEERFDLRAEIKDSYRFFYNHETTGAQLDRILWSDINNGSAGYEQFHGA
ncbi:ABC transporter substrate-binding protein [Kribbella sindirgiensis]|nr:ABC transporter substrate-binding protein [Kribbella sindirgiensis]